MKNFIPLIFYIFFILISFSAQARDYSPRYSTQLNPSDYLMGNRNDNYDSVFENYKKVDLGIDLGIGSDCGRVNLKSTLRASLKNLLDSRYFGSLGKDIIGSSPMLATCYFSPTWCSILKHTQMSANFLSQMRINQCSLIDKYTDSKAEDFYVERQKCVHKSIEKNGGDLEAAMEDCRNNQIYEFDLANWAGKNNGPSGSTNRLIESSAKWAGFEGQESNKTLDLVKSLVGDTVVTKGEISVDYGTRRMALTPRLHLMAKEKETFDYLCKRVMNKIDREKESRSFDSIVSEKDLEVINGSKKVDLIDQQTLRSLSAMPLRVRSIACSKLSSALAVNQFSNEMNKSLDMLLIAGQNPNLPEKRRKELELKRDSLKESVELTLKLHQEKNSPLNSVLNQINLQGQEYIGRATEGRLREDYDSLNSYQRERTFFDCSDGVMCNRR